MSIATGQRPKQLRYRLIGCGRCAWRWWSSSGENAPAMPTVHRDPATGEFCLHPDCWEIRTFYAVDMGPGLHPRQIDPPNEALSSSGDSAPRGRSNGQRSRFASLDELADRIERDRREPDKVLLDVSQIRGIAHELREVLEWAEKPEGQAYLRMTDALALFRSIASACRI